MPDFEPPPESQEAFVDVLSNTLGVVILLVLLFTLLSQSQPTARSHAETTPTYPVPPMQQRWPPPWKVFYVLRDNRLIKLDFAAVIEIIQQGQTQTRFSYGKNIQTGNTDQLDFTFKTRMVERDADGYELLFHLRDDYILQQPVFDETELPTVLSEKPTSVVPFFYVYPSGMTVFVPLFKALREKQIDFQWVALQAHQEMNLYRHAVQFERYALGFY